MKLKAPANALAPLPGSPQANKVRARKVLAAWFEPTTNLDDEQEYESWATRLNSSIAENLDADSLTHFIVLITKDRDKYIRSASARHAVNARHSKPGRARDKQSLIREAWASGKYSNRDLCAEQECAALDMAFSTARKALRGTPKPP
jgi:hypothetical protein